MQIGNEYCMHPVYDVTVRNRIIRAWWIEYKLQKKILKETPYYPLVELDGQRYAVHFAYCKWSAWINRKWGYCPKGCNI